LFGFGLHGCLQPHHFYTSAFFTLTFVRFE
jgi:hypothetical protein